MGLPPHHLEMLGEEVLLVGGEGDFVGAGVGGFDAGEVRIGVVGEVGQALGLFDPKLVPDIYRTSIVWRCGWRARDTS